MKRKLGVLVFALSLLAMLAGSSFSSVPSVPVTQNHFTSAHHHQVGHASLAICETLDAEDDVFPVFIPDAGFEGISSACFVRSNMEFTLFKQRVNMLPSVPVHLRTCTMLV